MFVVSLAEGMNCLLFLHRCSIPQGGGWLQETWPGAGAGGKRWTTHCSLHATLWSIQTSRCVRESFTWIWRYLCHSLWFSTLSWLIFTISAISTYNFPCHFLLILITFPTSFILFYIFTTPVLYTQVWICCTRKPGTSVTCANVASAAYALPATTSAPSNTSTASVITLPP